MIHKQSPMAALALKLAPFHTGCLQQPCGLPRFQAARLVAAPQSADDELWRSNLGVLRQRARRVLCNAGLQEGKTNVDTQPTTVITGELLWKAVKLPIYSVALVPLSVGSAVAFLESGAFDFSQYWSLLVSSVLVITWLNLSNDAYDAETGVDKDKKESVVNISGSQEGVLVAAYACLAFGCVGLVKGALVASDPRVILLLAAAISCGYVYQCPPFRLSYKGLGEPLCFLAFGPFATTAFYLSQSHISSSGILQVTPTILGASAVVGVTTSLILFCSHFHQIEGDKAVGKISPLVKLGTENGSKIVQLVITGLYAGAGALAVVKALPLPCALFSLLTLPIGDLVVAFVTSNHHDKDKIFLAKYYCVRLHAAFGTALVLGFVSQALLPRSWSLFA